jgi:hypothetical protein
MKITSGAPGKVTGLHQPDKEDSPLFAWISERGLLTPVGRDPAYGGLTQGVVGDRIFS